MKRVDWSKITAVEARHYRGQVFHFASLREALNCRNLKGVDRWRSGIVLYPTNNRYYPDESMSGANRKGYLHKKWADSPYHKDEWYYCGDYWLLFDEMGMLIPRWRILYEIAQEAYSPPWRYNPDYAPGGRLFRRGPVIRHWYGKGGRKWCNRGHTATMMRAMQTTQERRENDFLEYDEDALEYGIKPRPSRNLRNLPSWWDDKVTRRSAGWKAHRRHQYKDRG